MAKIVSVRCDLCNIEICHADSSKNETMPLDGNVIEVNASCSETDKKITDGQYCSPECASIAIENIIITKPIDNDRLHSLADKLGFDVIKKVNDRSKEESSPGA